MKRYVVIDEDGEEIGIFHILNLLDKQNMTDGDYEDFVWAERKFNIELPTPSYPDCVNTEAWFTDFGIKHFEEALDILKCLIEKYLYNFGYHFRELLNNPNAESMYSDKYQIIYYI